MLADKKRKTNMGVGGGLLLQLLGVTLFFTGETGALIGLGMILGSIPVFLWGCMNYSAGKGHSKYIGLLGLAGLLGLLVLVVLPDQHKAAA
jgi:hypothetical protein